MIKIPGITAKGAKPQFLRKKITPKIAQQILSECNIENRSLRSGAVRRWVAQFKGGEWNEWTNQSIAFCSEGILRDGQHRLHACVKSDIPFDTWVYLNMPAKSHKYIDIGVGRTLQDRTGLHRSIAAMVTLKFRLDSNDPGRKIGYDRALASYKKNKKGFDYSHNFKYVNGIPNCCGAAVLLALAEYHKKSVAGAEDFRQQFYIGVGCPENAPALALRAFLLSYRSGSLARCAFYDAAKQAMDAHHKDQELKEIEITEKMNASSWRTKSRIEMMDAKRAARVKKVQKCLDKKMAPNEIRKELKMSGGGYAEDLKFLGVNAADYAREIKAIGKQTDLSDILKSQK